MTTLTRPNFELYESWAQCVAEFEAGHIHASAMWLLDQPNDGSRESLTSLVAAVEANADTSKPAPGNLVHADSYWVTAGHTVIGFLQLRHSLNEYLLEAGGHIGYSIRPTYRGRGHATRALRLALDRARELKLDRVLVTCDDDNLASIKTIEGAGGLLEDVRLDKRRYWIAL